MNKKELEKMREKVKTENPLLTEDQIEDILAESETGASGEDVESGKSSDASVLHTSDPLLEERQALAKEREALEAEKDALAKEKAALAKEREQLEADKKALSEKEEAMKAAATPQASGTDSRDNGKAVSYVCKTRCTFRGQYYREGDSLTTTGDVPDFFEAVEEA